MSDSTSGSAPTPMAAPSGPPVASRPAKPLRTLIPWWEAVLWGATCGAIALGIWWFITRGEVSEERIVSRAKLPSPAETFGEFRSLWFDRALTRNAYASLRRVTEGFALAAIVGIPIGVLCGCFPRIAAFFAPISLFGRNIPMAALIPLTMLVFGVAEFQKVMFIFLSAVAFVISDSARAVADVPQSYVDTAYTLGASRRQVILKVLVPLALPDVFNSLRLLFGLAFGYIMLAEVVQIGSESGLGGIINVSQRRGPREHIYLVLMIIPLIALAIDRTLYWGQSQLFPYRYKSEGFLATLVRHGLHGVEDVMRLLWRPTVAVDLSAPQTLQATAPSDLPDGRRKEESP